MKAPDVNFPPHSMWHPNVDFDSGEVCAIRTLFGPTMMLKDIGNILHEFMLVPSLTTPTNVEAAGEMCNEVAKFEANARSKLAAAA
jgi:ubiquitin-protein ligase